MIQVLAGCWLIPDALDADSCRALIATSEARGYAPADRDYPPGYRTNDRQVLDDPILAGRLLDSVRSALPERIEHEGAVWGLVGLNERLRSCRYLPGQWFGRHRDGVHHRGPDERSLLTFMVYLDEPPAFSGGLTRFFDGRGEEAAVIAEVTPRAGALIVFDHDLWHDGAPVTAGCKHILRSDVLYRRLGGDAAAPRTQRTGHLGYVWSLTEQPDGTLASGGRDRTIRVWRDGLEVDRWEAHDSSVLAVRSLPDGRLVSAGRDRTVRLWSGHEPTVVRRHEGAALCVEVLPDGRIASGSADGTLVVGDGRGHGCERFAHGGWVRAIAVRGGEMVTACEDGVLRILGPNREEHDLGVPLWSVNAGPHGVAAGGADGSVHVLDHRGWQRFQAHREGVTSLAWLPDGRLVTGAEDDRITVWGPERLGTPLGEHGDFVRAVHVLRDGRVATAGYDGRVVLRDVG